MKYVFWAGVFLSFLVRTFFVLNGSEIADVHALKEMGSLWLGGINPYYALNYNVYPPLSIYIEALTSKLADFTLVPFYVLIKLWPNAADFLMTFVLLLFFKKNGLEKEKAYFWGLIFILNPVSIITSSAHGQIDSIVSLFVLISLFLLTAKITKYYLVLSALVFGLALSVKLNPLVLLPFLLFFVIKSHGFKNFFLFLSLVFVPLILFYLPFLDEDFWFGISKLLKYSGSNDIGIPAVIKAFYVFSTGNHDLILDKFWVDLSKGVFLAGWLGLVFFFRNSKNLIKNCLIVYILFFTFYFGISSQYLSWILPFLILLKDKFTWAFFISGFFAMISFYLFINPQMILTQFSFIPAFSLESAIFYGFCNLVFWFVCLWWLIKNIKTA